MKRNRTGNELMDKLELFIRKYYNNIAVRGCILFTAILLALFLIISLFEYYAYSNTSVRTCIFYGFLLLNAGVLTGMILLPLLRKAGWLKRLSYEEAARIIGKHFPEIDDKLLNTLQLHELAEKNPAGYSLLDAAIDRRIAQMKPFAFHKAIDFRKNLRYLKYALLPALVILLLLGWNSELFTGPTNRIIHHQTAYEKPAPYRFEWTNPVQEIFQDGNLQLNVRIRGDETPEEAYLIADGVRYRMEKVSPVEFRYELKRLHDDTRISFASDEVRSAEYGIKVLPKPSLLHFSVTLTYPAYLHKITETMENSGNITVPQGTRITWKFHTANSDEIQMVSGDNMLHLPCNGDQCSYSMVANRDFTYHVSSSNRYIENRDSLQYCVNVIPDAYPEIRVERSRDSLYADRFYFKGDIRDDYGFKKLLFVYNVIRGKDTLRSATSELPFQPDVTVQGFHFYFDAQTLSLNLGEELHYFFEVWDNDGVNGSKRSRTGIMEFRLPTAEEIREQSEQVKQQTKEGLSQIMQDNSTLMKRIEDLKKKMVSQKEAGWQEKKEMEELLKQWKELEKEAEKALEEQQRQQELESRYETTSEEILQKQEELQRRMDELFSDEMKQTMAEIQRMMEQRLDKDKLNEALDKIRMNTEELNKQLDENLALFKQLEVEQKMEEILEETGKLAEKQLELAKESADGKTDDEMLRKQQQLQKDFDQLMDDVQKLHELNRNLEQPLQIPEQKELENSIRQEMRKAMEQLKGQNGKQASPHQKKAGGQMNEMRGKMEESFQKSMEESAAEDVQTIRKILKNIVQTSFQQEKIMKQLSGMSLQDPQVKNVIREQYMLKENLRLIEDSISAVAKRQQAVKPFVHKQINQINQAQQQILSDIGQSQEQIYYYYRPRNFSNAVSKQQYVMTSLNDLALMLGESMNNIQQQQQGSKGGSSCKSGQCKQGSNGGGNNSKDMKSLREMQEQLNKQLEEMRRQQGGQQSKDGEAGKKQGRNGNQSEQFARMAARQEAIRRMTQEHLDKLQKKGEGQSAEAGNLKRMMKEMEQTEKELVNKILNQETIRRQREITTRMLQSERAEMQREKDDARESRQGRELQRTPPPDRTGQQERQRQQTEMYRTVPPSMAPFYRQKANQYFYHFE